MDRIVIVGAGVAGARAAEALRSTGYDGGIRVVGAEERHPYLRPPLSKNHLTSGGRADLSLRLADDLDVEWSLGEAAVRLDVNARSVALAGGSDVFYDGLVIATGAVARPWPGPPVRCADVVSLRSLNDANRIRGLLDDGARRIVVVGAGFVGGEVASSVRQLGHDVALVEIEETPLRRLLGSEVGTAIATLHEGNGIDLRLGHAVASFDLVGDRLTAVRLDNGAVLPADACVLALGGQPGTAWLRGSGLETTGGLLCREDLSVVDAPDVVAAGDVVRWPHAAFGGDLINVGHWTNAAAQGQHAARTLLSGGDRSTPFDLVPSFWSSLHGVSLRSVGLPGLADEIRVVDGALPELCATVGYLRDGKVVGVAGVNKRVDAYAGWIGRALTDSLELA